MPGRSILKHKQLQVRPACDDILHECCINEPPRGSVIIKQSVSGETEAIKEYMTIIKAKFRPLLQDSTYLEDVSGLLEAVPKMIDNVEAMADELDNAFNILNDTPKNEE
jgi:hypothetical protein